MSRRQARSALEATPRVAAETTVATVVRTPAATAGAVAVTRRAEAVTRFDWLFYVFGAFLVYTAWKL
ncbi:hypothetical protein AB0J43_52405, partial [Nonomuraea fuscirosea]